MPSSHYSDSKQNKQQQQQKKNSKNCQPQPKWILACETLSIYET